jgi:hypothetical protein
MDVLSITASIISIIGLAVRLVEVQTTFHGGTRYFIARSREDGFILSFLLHTIFRDALAIMQIVENYVLHAEDQQVITFLDSYTTSFNMIGVAVRIQDHLYK